MELRPAASARDFARLVAVRNVVLADDPVTPADVGLFLEAADADLRVVARADGADVGGVLAVFERSHAIPAVELFVVPDARRRGVGSKLYRAVSEWGRELGVRELEGWVEDNQADGAAFARHRGFRAVERELRVALDLTATDPPSLEPPNGVEITTLAARPELGRGLYEVALEAYPDIPGHAGEPLPSFERWARRDLGGAGDKPEATFVALAGDEVVGYSKFTLTEAQPSVAYHDLTGVKRAWRGRGVARALKAAQIRWAKEAGYERLITANEERNAPIRRLNERFGYQPAPGRSLFLGPLAPGVA